MINAEDIHDYSECTTDEYPFDAIQDGLEEEEWSFDATPESVVVKNHTGNLFTATKVWYPEGEFHCTEIKPYTGEVL